MPLALYLAIGTFALGIIGQMRGWWESPRRKEERDKVEADRRLNQAMATALLGTAEVRDNAGGILVPKAVGLVAKVENLGLDVSILGRDVSTLDRTVSTLVNQDSRIKALEAKDAEHDAAIAAIIAHTFDAGANAQLEAERLRAAQRAGTINQEES